MGYTPSDPSDPTSILAQSTPPKPPVLVTPTAGRSAFDGLTVRDYFAAAALQGLISAHAGDEISLPDPAAAAKWAQEYADALLARLGDVPFGG